MNFVSIMGFRLGILNLMSILCGILLLWACKKDDGAELPNSFPAKFSAERIELKNETRIFTQNGELKNPSLIEKFDEQLDWPSTIEAGFQANKGNLDFAFINDSTVHFEKKPFTGSDEGAYYQIIRKGTKFLMVSEQAYPIHVNARPENNNWGFLYHILKYKEKINTDPKTNPSDPSVFLTKDVRVAHGNFKVMKISCFEYYLKTPSSENSLEFTESKGLIWNEIDGSPGKFLGPRDSLVVKAYSTIFTIQQ